MIVSKFILRCWQMGSCWNSGDRHRIEKRVQPFDQPPTVAMLVGVLHKFLRTVYFSRNHSLLWNIQRHFETSFGISVNDIGPSLYTRAEAGGPHPPSSPLALLSISRGYKVSGKRKFNSKVIFTVLSSFESLSRDLTSTNLRQSSLIRIIQPQIWQAKQME